MTLDGSDSTDPNGDLLTFGWRQTGGPAVAFTPNISITTFTAPGSPTVLTFTLTVTDTGTLSDSDEIVVSVYNGQGATTITPTQPATFTPASTITINVPAGAISQSVTLVYSATTPANAAPSGFSFANTSFKLSAYQGQSLLPGVTFDKPITFTLRYSDTDIAGLQENQLELRYWNGSSWATDGITLVSHDKVNNTIVFAVSHLTEFALVGPEGSSGYSTFLPVVIKE